MEPRRKARPRRPVGVTIGDTVRTIFDEAPAANGRLDALTWDFDDQADTTGTPWTTRQRPPIPGFVWAAGAGVITALAIAAAAYSIVAYWIDRVLGHT